MAIVRIVPHVLLALIFVPLILGDDCTYFQEGTSTRIRIINRSGHTFTHVSLFSMDFGTIQSGDTTEYKKLNYDPLKDDPLIYGMKDETNYGRYVNIPDEQIQRYTYVIDSIAHGILYVGSYTDN